MGMNFSFLFRVSSRATLVKSLICSSQVWKTAAAADIIFENESCSININLWFVKTLSNDSVKSLEIASAKGRGSEV